MTILIEDKYENWKGNSRYKHHYPGQLASIKVRNLVYTEGFRLEDTDSEFDKVADFIGRLMETLVQKELITEQEFQYIIGDSLKQPRYVFLKEDNVSL